LQLQVEIESGETLLRSLRLADVNRARGTVKVGSLKSGSEGGTEVSLIRQSIGDTPAKQAAIEHVHHAKFWGFGVALAEALLRHGTLHDDRATFYGHANLDHGYDIPAGPPNTPPGMTEAYEEGMRRLVALAEEFRVAQDEDLSAFEWTGPSLQAP
jgi:hypothetical protein